MELKKNELKRMGKTNKSGREFFVCIVAGDEPEKLMAAYDKGIKEKEPYVVYKRVDCKKIKDTYIKVYLKLKDNLPEGLTAEDIDDTVEMLTSLPDDKFFSILKGDNYIDKKTGDVMSIKNKLGKYSSYTMGKLFSLPFILKDGTNAFQARKEDIDWSKIHRTENNTYQRAWEMVMEGSKPENEYETTIYENMKNLSSYFKKFGDKENYILSNTSFWGYAFLSDTMGWMDADETTDEFEWIKNFFDVFIKPLPPDTLLTIFECRV